MRGTHRFSLLAAVAALCAAGCSRDTIAILSQSDETPEAARPVAVLYAEHLSGDEGPQVILALWTDGRMIWSEDHHNGGSPFYCARIEPDKVQRALDELADRGLFLDPHFSEPHRPDRFSFTSLAIAEGDRRLWMTSAWQDVYTERQRQLSGIPAEVFDNYFVAWQSARDVLLALIPSNGRRARFAARTLPTALDALTDAASTPSNRAQAPD